MGRICKICGEPESVHHSPDFIEMPDGCVCDFRSWDYVNLKKIPAVCSKYIGNGKENCKVCEHDKGCHGKF